MTVGEEGGIVAFFAAFSLVFSFGCRSSAYEEYAFGEPVVLREDMKVSSEDFNAARVALVDSRKELEVEVRNLGRGGSADREEEEEGGSLHGWFGFCVLKNEKEANHDKHVVDRDAISR